MLKCTGNEELVCVVKFFFLNLWMLQKQVNVAAAFGGL